MNVLVAVMNAGAWCANSNSIIPVVPAILEFPKNFSLAKHNQQFLSAH